MTRDPRPVALVHMPIAQLEIPNLGLSLIKSELSERGIGSKVLYFDNLFASMVPPEFYNCLADGFPQVHDLAGEWIFAEALSGPDKRNDDAYLEEVIRGASPLHRKNFPFDAEGFVGQLQDARVVADHFLNRCLEEYPWGSCSVVGFSSTFQQHTASLALAQILRARWPNLTIVFGGANCHEEMGVETLRAFTFVDAICLGEGDTAFPDFVEACLSSPLREPNSAPPGILTRRRLSASSAAPRTELGMPRTQGFHPLTKSPLPDFDDFFDQATWSGIAQPPRVHLAIESSRGCWWGEKSQCTFCGLNAAGLTYRSKPATQVLAEITDLVARYGHLTRSFVTTDNIMPPEFVREMLPRLTRLGLDVSLFYESKANLRRSHLRTYRDAGVTSFQPGIESLSTSVLALMRKGVNSLQNVQLLKWSRYYGIAPTWNYLVNFPGETARDYAGQVELIPKLTHLEPPQYFGPIRFDRFSPYFAEPAQFGLGSLYAYPSYKFIYPQLPAAALENLAYFFVDPRRMARGPGRDMVNAVAREVHLWKSRSGPAQLQVLQEDSDQLLIADTRDCTPEPLVKVQGLDARVLGSCDEIASTNTISRSLGAPRPDVEAALVDLEDKKLIIREGRRVLSLVLPLLEDAPAEGRLGEQARPEVLLV